MKTEIVLLLYGIVSLLSTVFFYAVSVGKIENHGKPMIFVSSLTTGVFWPLSWAYLIGKSVLYCWQVRRIRRRVLRKLGL